MKKVLLLAAVVVALASCSKTDKNPVFSKGTEVEAFEGKVWSSVQVTPKGEPLEVSVFLSDDFLDSAPEGEGADPDHMHNSFVVPISQKGTETTPFQFIMLNWNPIGHEPEDVYTLPHLDIHFYMTPVEQVMQYTDPVKLENKPAADYIPAEHLDGPGVPMMGKHWLDTNSPEWHGATFDETFIYGSYDGKVVFYEPMITKAFLQTTSGYERSIPQPAKFQKAGYYPTRMKIKKKGGATEVALTDFVYRQAS